MSSAKPETRRPTTNNSTKATTNNSSPYSPAFVETIEYSPFVEFCDACRHFRYIGLCYGPPGIGKTLSAVRYSRAEKIIAHDRWTSETTDDLPVNTLLYTTSVVNTPSRISQDISMAREKVMSIVLDPLRREGSVALDAFRIRDEKRRKEILDTPGFSHATGHQWIQPTLIPTRNIERKSEQWRIPPR